jgi:hypothetical protein
MADGHSLARDLLAYGAGAEIYRFCPNVLNFLTSGNQQTVAELVSELSVPVRSALSLFAGAVLRETLDSTDMDAVEDQAFIQDQVLTQAGVPVTAKTVAEARMALTAGAYFSTENRTYGEAAEERLAQLWYGSAEELGAPSAVLGMAFLRDLAHLREIDAVSKDPLQLPEEFNWDNFF